MASPGQETPRLLRSWSRTWLKKPVGSLRLQPARPSMSRTHLFGQKTTLQGLWGKSCPLEKLAKASEDREGLPRQPQQNPALSSFQAVSADPRPRGRALWLRAAASPGTRLHVPAWAALARSSTLSPTSGQLGPESRQARLLRLYPSRRSWVRAAGISGS